MQPRKLYRWLLDSEAVARSVTMNELLRVDSTRGSDRAGWTHFFLNILAHFQHVVEAGSGLRYREYADHLCAIGAEHRYGRGAGQNYFLAGFQIFDPGLEFAATIGPENHFFSPSTEMEAQLSLAAPLVRRSRPPRTLP